MRLMLLRQTWIPCRNNVSIDQLEEDVDCDENGVVKDDDYKVLQTLNELLGVNVILR